MCILIILYNLVSRYFSPEEKTCSLVKLRRYTPPPPFLPSCLISSITYESICHYNLRFLGDESTHEHFCKNFHCSFIFGSLDLVQWIVSYGGKVRKSFAVSTRLWHDLHVTFHKRILIFHPYIGIFSSYADYIYVYFIYICHRLQTSRITGAGWLIALFFTRLIFEIENLH